ncbi:MAG: BatD family protein [Vulcanimicrobiota bacterium]
MKKLLIIFLWVGPVWAQTPSPTPKGPPIPVEASLNQEPFKVTVKADKDHFELGQPVHLVYQIQGPENAQFSFPEAEKFEIKPFEVRDANPVTLTASQGQRNWEYRVKATAYETGNLKLPEATLSVKLKSDAASQDLKLPGLSLEVERVPQAKEDKPDEVRDAHSLALNGVPLVVVLAVLLGAILVALICWWVVRWLRRPKRVEAPPALPPYPWALKELARLHSERPDQKGQWEVFYDELSHLLRFYLGWRFSLPLLEQTTSETMRHLTLPDLSHRQFKELLETADMVKFARSFPTAEKASQHLTWAQQLVEGNAPAEVEVARRDS